MFMVFTGIWAAVAIAAIITWIVAMFASYREDDTVHLAAGEENQINEQVRNASRMKAIERWRMGLSVTTVVGGVIVLGFYLYLGLTQGGPQFK
jgi:hypothetical protein